MKIQAEVVAHSIDERGEYPIASFMLTYPRIIHAELMTHRMFSRNAASSRAIPATKMIRAIEEDPFIPIAWQKEHSGMQGFEYITDPIEIERERLDWLDDCSHALEKARQRIGRKITKQLINRPLEPFQWYKTLVTATDLENFFALRCPKYGLFHEDVPLEFRSRKDLVAHAKKAGDDVSEYEKMTDLDWLQVNKGAAEIHMMTLAEVMWDAYKASTPKILQPGEWHIPFGDNIPMHELINYVSANKIVLPDSAVEQWKYLDMLKVKIATARCARTSYTLIGEEDKPFDFGKDIQLHDRLLTSGHMSPFEHCGKRMTRYEESIYNLSYLDSNGNERIDYAVCGNFHGWVQYRKTIKNENIR